MVPIGDASPIIIKMDEKRYWGEGEWTAEGKIVFEESSDNRSGENVEKNKVYDDENTIKKVQEFLNQKGYNCGEVDGKSGGKTIAMISKYRSDNGLIDNGIIDDELLNSMGLQ